MSDKRKRSLSIKELIKDDPPKKEKKDKKCLDMVVDTPPTVAPPLATHEDMERIITRLEELRGFIVRLHDMCLQAVPEDSLEVDVE